MYVNEESCQVIKIASKYLLFDNISFNEILKCLKDCES